MVQQHAATPGFVLLAKPFGTVDLAVILARITAGLRRAAALEEKLYQRAARGRDLAVASIRLPVPRTPSVGRLTAPPDTAPDPQPATPADPRLAHGPTEQEIADQVRRRPIGAVIADICTDLGIAPGDLDRAFWDEIQLAIMLYGGSLWCFLTNLDERLSAAWASIGHVDRADPEWPAALLAPATRPP